MKGLPTKERNFSSISPSAKWILKMKAHTNIPYAREAAGIVENDFIPGMEVNDPSFWGRTFHFESRYQSINSLANGLNIKNIIELSSGFSFRGIDWTKDSTINYFDTDLPGVIAEKKEITTALLNNRPVGNLRSFPLDALNEKQFSEVMEEFPAGEVLIINEGLLMYLDNSEKEKLCSNIRKALEQRGGYWITADIYLQLEKRNIELGLDAVSKKFFDDHKVDQNKFESFEAAAAFFRREGFVIEEEAVTDYSAFSSFHKLLQCSSPESIANMQKMEKVHATWRLRLA